MRHHAYQLRWLNERMDFPENDVPSCEDVMKYLSSAKLPLNRKKNIICALKVWHRAHGNQKCCEQYAKPLVECNRECEAITMKQERTNRQAKNWVEYDIIKKFTKDLTKEVFGFNKNNFWVQEQFIKAQLAFILNFHLKNPIRRELCTVTWGKEQEGNYIDEKKKIIRFENHKVKKHMGTIKNNG